MEYANFRSAYTHHNVLQTLAFESSTFFHFPQHFFKYTEPIEFTTASPLDLSIKSHQNATPITPPCTPSPGNKKSSEPSPPPIDVPLKKPKLVAANPLKKNKVTRKLNFDEDNSSPVSGTIIRELGPNENLVVRKGDIDPAFNVVEITEEAKAELAKIENLIGDYVCR